MHSGRETRQRALVFATRMTKTPLTDERHAADGVGALKLGQDSVARRSRAKHRLHDV